MSFPHFRLARNVAKSAHRSLHHPHKDQKTRIADGVRVARLVHYYGGDFETTVAGYLHNTLGPEGLSLGSINLLFGLDIGRLVRQTHERRGECGKSQNLILAAIMADLENVACNCSLSDMEELAASCTEANPDLRDFVSLTLAAQPFSKRSSCA